MAAGGVGIQLLCRLRDSIIHDEASAASKVVEAIALDTDRDELRDACSSRWKSPLSSDDTLHLPLRLPSNYDNSRDILSWVSRRWLYNIPRSLETRGFRPLGASPLWTTPTTCSSLSSKSSSGLQQTVGSAGASGENARLQRSKS